MIILSRFCPIRDSPALVPSDGLDRSPRSGWREDLQSFVNKSPIWRTMTRPPPIISFPATYRHEPRELSEINGGSSSYQPSGNIPRGQCITSKRGRGMTNQGVSSDHQPIDIVGSEQTLADPHLKTADRGLPSLKISSYLHVYVVISILVLCRS